MEFPVARIRIYQKREKKTISKYEAEFTADEVINYKFIAYEICMIKINVCSVHTVRYTLIVANFHKNSFRWLLLSMHLSKMSLRARVHSHSVFQVLGVVDIAGLNARFKLM